jgi:type IV pilus assembly protein PilM
VLVLLSRKSQIVGLDIGSHTVKLAQIVERGKDLVLAKYAFRELDPEAIVDGAIMDRSQVAGVIAELLQETQLRAKETVIGVSGNSVIVKRITLPEMGEDELSESIKWEAEQYIPFAIDDVNLDFQILGPSAKEGANTMDVVLVAAKKDKINDYVTLVTEAGLNPVIMDVDAFALENMFEVNYEISPGRVDALVNVGAAVMNINILKDGASVFTRDSSVGGNLYTESLQKEFGIGFAAAENLKKGDDSAGVDLSRAQSLIGSVTEDIIAEAARSIDFFRATTGIENVDRVILSGGAALMAGFPERLAERAGVEVELANPFRNISLDPKLDPEAAQNSAPSAAVVVGLALRRLKE